jgi:carbon-monoxide dehydrogenase medium subunit
MRTEKRVEDPMSYDYHRPDDVKEACRLLAELPEPQVLAGGTDLLFDIDAGVRQAQHVISLQRIDGLRQIEETDTHVVVGAMCTARNVQSSSTVQKHFPEITDMVVKFASPPVRTRATVAGNICSAVPCGDFPVILIALGAEVDLTSVRGARRVILSDFFTGPRETVREKDELLTRILVPKKQPGSAACYLKFQRRASNSLAVAGVGSFLRLHDGSCREARIVLGAVAPIPLLAKEASASLIGKHIDQQTIQRAAELARDEAKPITDVRGREGFRRELVYVLTQRALHRAAEKIERPG